MALLTKPNMQQVWASGGDIVEPSDLKKQQGWTVEVPPHQFENWIQNRQDEYLAHINQRGIPQWDSSTEYEAGGLSYVQGSDGKVYKSVAASGPSGVVQNPATDGTDTYWITAFAPDIAASETEAGFVELATNLEVQAGVDTTRAVTPASLSSRTSTEVRTGLIEIATTAEAEAGIDDQRAMTPLKVKQAIIAQAGASTEGVAGSASNLKASATGTSSTVTVTADAICLKNAANEQVVVNSVAVAPSLAASGVDGLDTGVSAINTWYSVWVIWNGTTAAGLLSASPTSPILPAGYTHKARIGWVRTDGTANKYPLGFAQFGRKVSLVVKPATNVTSLPSIVSGVAGDISAPTWVSASLANYVPPTASHVRVISAKANDSSSMILAPSNGYGGFGTYTNMPPVALNSPNPYANVFGVMSEFLLETMAVFYASNGATNNVRCMGWEDNL